MTPNSLPARLSGKLYRVFVALLVAYAAISSFGPVMNQTDLGWQVAQGRWMVEHGALYTHDVLNYPNLGRPVINEYPLFEIALYAAWSVGWWGPCLLTAAGYVLIIALITRGAGRVGLPASALTALALGAMFLYFQIAWPLRPHLVTYLGVTFFGTFLLAHRGAARWTAFWPLVVAQIVWTNCHSGFIFGPALVGLFGAEMTLRRWLRERAFPRAVAMLWLSLFAMVLAACLVNPHGYARFYPPFFQDRLESIRAYVGEMEPLTGGAATLTHDLTGLVVVVIAAAIIVHRGGVSFAFLGLAVFTLMQAEEIKKAWPVFGLFVPLLVVSTAAFAPRPRASGSWMGMAALFGAAALALIAVVARVNPAWDSSVARQWREFDAGHTELPVDAVAWMRANHIEGRLFHRCEDGGLLQEAGYDAGQTYADTGFGQYDERFIHEVGLVNERPALVPLFIAKYKPDFVVCGNLAYQWPYYLRQAGWRLIFYTPNSSVWTRAEVRPDLPTVTDEEIKAAFNRDLAENGEPANVALLGRNIIALNSLGLEQFAFDSLMVPTHDYDPLDAPWQREAARILCNEPHVFPIATRDDLKRAISDLYPNSPQVRELLAYCVQDDPDAAFKILQSHPEQPLSNAEAQLLLRIELARNDPAALALARRTDCWDLRNGKHWQYLAQAEERWGTLDAARAAWRRAVFYYPDDAELMSAASAFAAQQHDAELAQQITDTVKLWSAP